MIPALDGHAWKSFSADYDSDNSQSHEVNWLSDVLPKALAKRGIAARVMTFSYDPDSWIKGPPREMDMPSNDLLSSLESDHVKNFVVGTT